jgi:hypothetical protein
LLKKKALLKWLTPFPSLIVTEFCKPGFVTEYDQRADNITFKGELYRFESILKD